MSGYSLKNISFVQLQFTLYILKCFAVILTQRFLIGEKILMSKDFAKANEEASA